jgi:hypothetical protein
MAQKMVFEFGFYISLDVTIEKRSTHINILVVWLRIGRHMLVSITCAHHGTRRRVRLQKETMAIQLYVRVVMGIKGKHER